MDNSIIQCSFLRAASRRGLLILGVWLCLQGAQAALLLYEGFDYPVREELGEVASGLHWDNDKHQFTIVNGSLDYAGLKAATGNRLNAAAAAPSLDSVRTLDGSWPKQTKGTLYVSFILRLHSLVEISDTNEGVSLLTLGDTFNRAELLGINLKLSGGVKLGVLKYPSSSVPVSSVFCTAGPGANLSADSATTYFIVAKYEWVEGADNDVVTLWVNPVNLGATEDLTNKVSISTGADGTAGAGRLTLTRGPNVNIDELRLGTTWAEVTPPREPPPRWFLAVALLAGGLVGAGFWITRLRRKVAERSAALGAQIQERQRAEHQRLMEQERARIAHDLHDELGADITEIGMLATRAQNVADDGETGRRCLKQMADKTKQMVTKLEEIVWAMSPEHDSLSALVSYFSYFADRFLGLANIKLTVDTSPDAASLVVEARIRHQLFLVFKEALANVVRHSRASEVRFVVRVENRTLSVVIADNGCGLRSPDPTAGGLEGLANMRRRMQKLNGQFEIAGEPDHGTMVKFLVPLES